jgi:hypothetical protein
MKRNLFLLIFFLPVFSHADVYDDFIEKFIIQDVRDRLVQRYQDQQVPEGKDGQKWREGTEKLTDKVKSDLGIGGPVFVEIKESYRNQLTTEDIEFLQEFVANPRYQAIMGRNNSVKQEVMGIIQNYVFEDLGAASSRVRLQE